MDDRYSERTEKPEDKSRQEKRDQKNKKERADDKKRDRGTIAATVEEAIENAGSQVLSFLESRAHVLTVEEREEYLAGLQIEGEVFPYAGPYTEEEDARNLWTAYQPAAAVVP